MFVVVSHYTKKLKFGDKI